MCTTFVQYAFNQVLISCVGEAEWDMRKGLTKAARSGAIVPNKRIVVVNPGSTTLAPDLLSASLTDV